MNKISLLSDLVYESCILPSMEKEMPAASPIVQTAKGYLQLGLKGLNYFLEGRLAKLDALVGDNACQKRAIMMVNYHEQSQLEEHQSLKAALKTVETALELLQKAPPSESKGRVILKTMLEGQTLDKKFNTIVLTYILYKTRSKNNRQATDHKKLASMPEKYRENITFRLKEQLSKHSLDYLKSLECKNKTLVKLIDKDTTDTPIRMTPCYFNLKLILKAVEQQGRPLALRFNHGEKAQMVYFEIIEGKYARRDALSDEKRAVFVIEGSSDHPHAEAVSVLFEKSGIPSRKVLKELLLSNAAHHPPYTANMIIKMKEIKEVPAFDKPYLLHLEGLHEEKKAQPEKSYEDLVEEKIAKLGDKTSKACVRQMYGSNPHLTLDKVMREYEKYIGLKKAGAEKNLLNLFHIKHIYPAMPIELSKDVQ